MVAVRKQHNDGNRHKQNVCEYYRQFIGMKTQRLIDEIVANFEIKVMQGVVRPTFGFPSLNGVPAALAPDDNPPAAIDPAAAPATPPAPPSTTSPVPVSTPSPPAPPPATMPPAPPPATPSVPATLPAPATPPAANAAAHASGVSGTA